MLLSLQPVTSLSDGIWWDGERVTSSDNKPEIDEVTFKEFADRVNDKPVWSKLADAQLEDEMIQDCITSYIKAKDPSRYLEVINAAQRMDFYDDLCVIWILFFISIISERDC